MPTDAKRLADRIAKAFPSPFNLSHDDCVEIRGQLFSGQDEDVLKFIGPVLLDLLFYHSRSSCDPATADSVIRFLASAAPPPLQTMPGQRLDTAQIVDFSIDQQADSASFFRQFTEEQASAIREWLLAALSWNEPHLPEVEIKAALDYWGKPR
jgi:hypothetical protein